MIGTRGRRRDRKRRTSETDADGYAPSRVGRTLAGDRTRGRVALPKIGAAGCSMKPDGHGTHGTAHRSAAHVRDGQRAGRNAETPQAALRRGLPRTWTARGARLRRDRATGRASAPQAARLAGIGTAARSEAAHIRDRPSGCRPSKVTGRGRSPEIGRGTGCQTRFLGMGDNLGDNYFLAQRPKNSRHIGNTAHNAKNLSKIMGDNWVIILQRKR